MKRLILCQIVVVLFLITAGAYGQSADDYWPTWRGPIATGAAEKGNPPLTWSETENIKWKAKLPGEGSSSPVIWGEKIFFQAAVKTDAKGTPASSDTGEKPPFHGGKTPTNVHKFDLVCLDRKTGKTLWQKTVSEVLPHEGHHPNHGFASFSPVTDGKYVWASFGSRGVYCYDVDGNHKWSRDLGKMKTRNAFGEGASPALAGDALIVLMDQEGDSFVYALDKKTGKTIWKKSRDEGTSWSTPIVVEVEGKLQVIINATNFVRCYDVKTGKLIWQCGGMTKNAIPSPVIGFGKVFCTSGFRGSALLAIELGRTGDLTDSDAIKWQVDEATPYVSSPLLYGDKIYVCSVLKGIVSCYEAKTGKPHFVKKRLDAIKEIYASPAAAAGRVYFVGRNGVTYVIKSSEDLEVLSINKLDDRFDCSPAFVDNEMFLKGKQYLYCIASSKH